jgi:hypothetical protein
MSAPLGGAFPTQTVNVGSNLNMDNVSINNLSVTSASIGHLKANIFSQNILNTSTINASELNLPPDYIIPYLNVSQLIAFKESFIDLSTVNVSATNISAVSITAPNVQETLTAGSNINISGTVISATGILPSIGNFTEINTSQINASNLSTADLSIGTNLTLTNKLLNVNSTANVTQNSADLITSGAVYSALNGTGGGDSRSLTNTQLYLGGNIIKPIVPGTVSTVDVNIPPGSSRNMMKVFYITKFGPSAILNCTATFSYEMGGYNGDSVNARLIYNNGVDNTISRQEQIWRDHNGGGTRSGVLSPRIGNRTSAVSAGTTVYFQLLIDNNSNDDTWTFLFPDSCTFQITETLDNDGGSDLNLHTGDIAADQANFNSLSILEGSPAGQANIGRAVIGNDGHSDRMAISINGNVGATDYAFAQVADDQTIMNAQSSSTYNSFRVEDQEVASINNIGLAIGYETAFFPLSVSGDAFMDGIAFITQVDTGFVDSTNLSGVNVSLVNLSSTRSSIDNLSVANITITGNITANDLNLSTGNLVPGDNITVENNVISAYLSSDSQANLNSLQVDNTVDVFGVLNVSQTSNFQDSLNVSNNLYVGKSGQHAGDIVLYSGVVGNNFVQSFNSSGYEVNISATGNSSSINYFVGNQPCLEIRNNGIETLNIQADSLTADTLGGTTATFNQVNVATALELFNCNLTGANTISTFQLNAGTADVNTINNKTINSSTINASTIEIDELDLTTINSSNGNFSTAFANQLNASTCILSDITANEITTQTITATSNFATPSANFSSINSSNLRSNSVNTFSFNLSDQSSSDLSMTMNRDGGVVTILNNAGSIVFNTNTNSTNRALIMDSNNLIQTRTIQNAGILESRNISTDENVSVGGSLSVGGSIEGYQQTLLAGDNITITGNTISSSPPSIANFSTITSQTTNTSFLNTSFITCNDEASFGNGVAVTGEIECDELDTDQVYTINISSSALDTDSITTGTITSFQYNISDTADDAEASFLFRNGATTRFIHTGGRLRFECDELQTSGVANFSSINSSNIVGYQETVVAGDNITITGNTISTTANANFSSVTAEFINSSNVVNVSEIIGSNCDFGSGYIQSFKSELINASNMNLSNEFNASVVNATQINASNISGYQETLLAGTNITITGNTISSAGPGGVLPANVNFSSVNTSTLNTSTIDSGGRVDIGDADGQSQGLVLTGTEPTIAFKDTNARSGMIHMNDNNMYFLSGGTNSEVWSQVNGQWPLILHTYTNRAQFGGNIDAVGNITCGGYMRANDKPRVRIERNNFTLPSGTTSLLNGGSVSLQSNCIVSSGIFIATISGIYACFCKLRLPDDNNQSPEIQWYRRASNGSQSKYENFEMWIPQGVDGRRAGMSHTLIELSAGQGILPRNDLNTMGGCVATFDVFMIQ